MSHSPEHSIKNQTATRLASGPQVVALVASLAVCFAAAAIGGWVTTSSLADWYAGINKPAWNPPEWLFGPVWTTLFAMMSVAAWLVWRASGFRGAQLAFVWFGLQLLLNVFWSFLFFGQRNPGWAAIEIVVLWLAIAITIALFWKHSRLAALLMVPYLLWVSFAAFLNFTIWQLNM
ncbi:MAG: TspO/MBR family protein [Pirellulaceae bacterium]